MIVSTFFHRALFLSGAVALFAGCESSQARIPSPVPMPAEARAGANPSGLLYITTPNSQDVLVYSYPQGTLRRTLTGFSQPSGDCVDKSGDVFIANSFAGTIVEYAHGGGTPIATLNDASHVPYACSIDPTTGNLAVVDSNFEGAKPGVAIYKNAAGTPKYYSNPDIGIPYYCGYDSKGNLFVDGYESGSHGSPVALGELPSGAKTFVPIKLNQAIKGPGGVQFDGTNLAVGDNGGNVIYRFAIKNGQGTKVGSTTLEKSGHVLNFWIEGSTVIGVSNFNGPHVAFWNYPTGGFSTKRIKLTNTAVGVVVSTAK